MSAVTVGVLVCALGATPAELAAGQRLYRDGLLPSGRPVLATVQGDVAVSGAQVTCVSCHGRSGLGSVEGSRVTVPISAPFLALPRALQSRPRPPYDAATLGRAIREGVDSGGHPLDPMMPRFHLEDSELAALVAYLGTLSREPSPGASLQHLDLATVVTPDADPAAREAMLTVLRTWFEKKSAAARSGRGWHSGDWPEYYGEWRLHVWELAGPSTTWRAQLDARLAAEPVFAMVSGLGAREWAPVHEFCEAHELPCLLPNVDTPPSSDGTYSLYFSRGLELEAATFVRQLPAGSRVVQVSRVAGERAARAVRDALGARVVDVAPGELARRVRQAPGAVVAVWLDVDELSRLPRGALTGATAYFSATLLGGEPPALDLSRGFLLNPFAPSAEAALRFSRVSGWLQSQGVTPDPRQRRIEDQTFFAATVLSEGVMHLRKNLQRDYLLELIDHFPGFDGLSSSWPRLSFGPGQRVLAKGCYVVPLRNPAAPVWVVP
jgi:mono/diheme cytochrome c family protein